MTRTTRKALLGAALGMLALAAAVPMVVSGTASAQEGSRLCGRFFKSPRTNEVTVRIVEVRKSDQIVCNEGSLLKRVNDGESLSPKQSPFLRTFKDLESVIDWRGAAFELQQCEGWKTRGTDIGGLGNKTINFIGDNFPTFIGDNFPTPHRRFDICRYMNRSDTIFEMNEYWLYSHPDSPTVSLIRS